MFFVCNNLYFKNLFLLKTKNVYNNIKYIKLYRIINCRLPQNFCFRQPRNF